MVKTLKSLPLQSVFLLKVKEVLPPNIGLAEELADILGVSTDSAYRRIRCETELSIDEVCKIAKKYSLSLDGIFSNLGDTVTFTYTKLTDNAENFEKYLNRIYNHVKAINAFPEKKITYIAEEVPIFYSFFSDRLTQFKLFYWQRSVLNIPMYQGKKFEFGIIPQAHVDLALNAFKEYRSIPSVEVWTNETIHTVLKKVEFYAESGAFQNTSDALAVLDEIKKMAAYLEQCAETGRKEISAPTENLAMYCSDVVLGTNCIYINSGASKYAYITFNSLNSLTTNNQEFCEETEHWVKNIVKKSTLISGVAEKQRFKFFNQMYKTIDACYERVSKM